VKSKKILATVMAAAVVATSFIGCKKTEAPTPAGNDPKAQAGPAMDKEQYLNVVLAAEPKTLDASKATDLYSSQILQSVMEGLTRVEQENGKDVVKPAGAESWTVSQDGLKWTFKLRDFNWSDGQKVTAQQFEYGIKRTLAPETASQYSFLLFPIKGAAEYNGKKGSADQVGVKAVDEKTLEFTLAAPTPYFLDLTYFKVFQPQREDLIKKYGDKFGTEAETMVFNGPFAIKEWMHGSKVELVKNDKYWDAKSVKLNNVTMKIILDESARMQELLNGGLDSGAVSKPEWIKQFDASGKFDVIKGNDPSASYFYFNQQKKPFNNTKVRKAFSLAVTREDIVQTLYKGLADPAYGWSPPSLQIAGEDFRKKANYEPITDLKKANPDPKALLIEGLKELGMDPDPTKLTVTFLSSGTSATQKEFAEYFQQMFKKNLGIEMKVEAMEWAVFSKRTDDGDYEIASAGWTGDYNDPMTMFDMWVTGADIVPTFWSNKTYDELIKKAGSTSDQAVRFQAFKDAEKILLADEAVIAPYVYRQRNTYRAKYVKNVMATLFGSGSELKYAYTQGRP
jgi:oligopeptide transport system substrate-binding protein